MAVSGNTLPALEMGEYGEVVSIDGTTFAAKRLADMGFVRGAELMMLRPGAPCIVRINGRCVGLGASHQRNIRLL